MHNKIIILDGGMGQELLARSQREVTTMWSADVMLHEPELVRELHCEFICAGADIITLNTYTATPERLANNNALHLMEQLHESAKQAAVDAISDYHYACEGPARNIQIAGCLPPLVASYHPEVSPEFADCVESYRKLVKLQRSGADLFICETMSSTIEAKAACLAAKEAKVPVWVAFSVSDDEPKNLRGGESLQDAVAEILTFAPDAILLNCSRPESINAVWPELQNLEVPVGVYANGFTSIDSLYPGTTVASLAARDDLGPSAYAQICADWAKQGASIIGGCCEVGPTHIASLCELLKKK